MDIGAIIEIIKNPQPLLESLPPLLTYAVLFFTIFAESGLLIGFFLPGDSLLFIAGILASVNSKSDPSQMFLNILILLPLLIVAAVLGDNVGFYTGKYYGKRLFEKEDGIIFKKRYLIIAKKYYDKRGSIAIILARFVPAVRAFAPIIAGVVDMNHSKFMKYNFIGGVTWVTTLLLLGYFLGAYLRKQGIDIEKIILPITIIVVICSFGIAYLESKHSQKEGEELPEIVI